MSVGGGSPMQTAGAVLQAPVSREVAREWGEAIWTAPSLAQEAFAQSLRRASVGWLLGIRSEPRS